jgi:hypothetical protein
MMALAADGATAQLDTLMSHCLQFDRQYFRWGGRPPGGGDWSYDSSAVVRLLPQRNLHLGPRSRRLLVPSMGVATRLQRVWEYFSYWQLHDADTVIVAWTNGMYGPVFVMGVRGDTLRGRVRFTTDVYGAEEPQEDAWAVRIPCR